MRQLRIGMPLVGGVLGYQEGAHYNYTVSGHTLTMALTNPSPAQIRAVQRGVAWFGLVKRDNAIFILSRFGHLPWTVTAYNWWINAPVMRPDPWDDLVQLRGGFSAGVCLVDAGNGLVAALRSVTLSEELSQLFMGMVQEQMRPPFDPWHYLDVVNETLNTNRDPKALVKDAACMCVANLASWQPFSSLNQAVEH